MGNQVQTVLEAIADSLIPKIALLVFVGALLLTIVTAAIQNVYSWNNAKPPHGINSIDVSKLGIVTGTAGTATAFLVTLFVAERNYRRSREHIPNLSMTLLLERIPVSKTYDAVIVTLNATNTGSGLCRVREIDWDLKVLSPYDDEAIEAMRTEFEEGVPNPAGAGHADGEAIEFPWHVIRQVTTTFDLSIEPKETEQTTQDFIIPEEITAVVASAWVANASVPKQTEGWYRRKAHYRGAENHESAAVQPANEPAEVQADGAGARQKE